MSEETLLESGQLLTHHNKDACSGNCCLHGTSTYTSCRMPRSWRTDKGQLEHHCEHGVSHPCAAGLEYKRVYGIGGDWSGTHGCCEEWCCGIGKPDWAEVNDEDIARFTSFEGDATVPVLDNMMSGIESLQEQVSWHSQEIGMLRDFNWLLAKLLMGLGVLLILETVWAVVH